MVWDIILQAAAEVFVGAAVGAAVGYGVAAIIEGLSRAFARLWENLVASAKTIFRYLTDATQRYLALVAQFLDNNWPQIESYLRQEFGYRSEWLLAVFRHGIDIILALGDPRNMNRQPIVISLKPLKDQQNVQLPTMQSPIVATLTI